MIMSRYDGNVCFHSNGVSSVSLFFIFCKFMFSHVDFAVWYYVGRKWIIKERSKEACVRERIRRGFLGALNLNKS